MTTTTTLRVLPTNGSYLVPAKTVLSKDEKAAKAAERKALVEAQRKGMAMPAKVSVAKALMLANQAMTAALAALEVDGHGLLDAADVRTMSGQLQRMVAGILG